jgi:cell division protein FtsZ
MTVTFIKQEVTELKPRITVFGVGGAGGNAVNNMIDCGLQGVEFVVANTDAQALGRSRADRVIQMGLQVTEGLGAGAQPEVGRAAAEEAIDEIRDHLNNAHMVFITAGMGGGTGTGAAPVVARVAREMGILTVGVVTKPFQFEGVRRMRICESGIGELQKHVDTLIVIPNQNLFRVANNRTTFAEAFAMADQVLYAGVASITDLMVKPGLINLDFADVRAVMREMGKAMMGTGEASGDNRAIMAAEAAIANPLLDEVSMKGAKGLLISITGGKDMMLYELDEAATRIREEVDPEANIILGATQDESLEGMIRVSVVATGIDRASIEAIQPINPVEQRISEAALRLRQQVAQRAVQQEPAIVMPRAVQSVPAPVSEVAAPVAVPVATVMPQMEPPAPAPVAALAIETPPAAFPQAEPAAPVSPVAVAGGETKPTGATCSQPAPTISVDDLTRMLEAAQRAQAARAASADPAIQRPVRLPHVNDLPAHVQPRIDNTAPVAQPMETRRMSLMDRLKAVGIGVRGDAAAAVPPAPPVEFGLPPVEPRRAPAPVAARAPEGRLDQHGRVQPRATFDDDQLEIPAFLRRQTG